MMRNKIRSYPFKNVIAVRVVTIEISFEIRRYGPFSTPKPRMVTS